MNFDQYLKRSGLTLRQFASEAGIHPATLYRIQAGAVPSGNTIRKLIAASHGKLTAAKLIAARSAAQ